MPISRPPRCHWRRSVGLSVNAFFDFARHERPSFDLLFRSEPGRPGPEIGRRAVDEVIDRIAELVSAVYLRTGRTGGPSVELIAAADAGVAIQVCLYAIDHGRDLDQAERLAAGYIEGAQRGMDPRLLADIDRA